MKKRTSKQRLPITTLEAFKIRAGREQRRKGVPPPWPDHGLETDLTDAELKAVLDAYLRR